jgi:hypothetical protein
MRNDEIETAAAETVTHVRQVLGPADPAGGRRHADLAGDETARATLANILTTRRDAGAGSRRRRRRWTVAGVAVLAVGTLAAGADAGGLVPSGVVRGFLRIDSDYTVYGHIDAAHARLLVQASTPEGETAQWWEAPTTKGGWCTYDRVLRRGKDGRLRAEHGGAQCGMERTTPPPDVPLDGGYAVLFDDRVGVVGRAAKPAAGIRLTLKDGRRISVPVNSQGYFMAIFDRSLATENDQSRLTPATIVVLDPGGRVLVRAHLCEPGSLAGGELTRGPCPRGGDGPSAGPSDAPS